MNYAVANSEGVFIREETLEDDESLIEDYRYENEYVGQKRRILQSPEGSPSKRMYTSSNENEDIDDIFYPRDILSKITGNIDEVEKDSSTKKSVRNWMKKSGER
nr:unnamed protein product [Callosobruchus chinensis]